MYYKTILEITKKGTYKRGVFSYSTQKLEEEDRKECFFGFANIDKLN